MKKSLLFVAILATLIVNSVFAADSVYEYVDKNGNVTYSNKPSKNAKKVTLPPISVYSAPMSLNSYSNKPSAKNSGIKTIYPKSSVPQYSGTNETGRKQILTEELASEKLALVDSQQALSEAKKIKLSSEKTNDANYQKRIQALEDSVTEHQKNIDILNKQLGFN